MSGDKRWQVRIEHILEAIGKIQRYASGLTEDTFSGLLRMKARWWISCWIKCQSTPPTAPAHYNPALAQPL
jgi:hypothetical protein